MNPNIECKTGK